MLTMQTIALSGTLAALAAIIAALTVKPVESENKVHK